MTGNTAYNSGVVDDGGIALLTSASVVVDMVGMGSGSAFKEGSTLAPLTTNVNQSFERKPVDANTQDTDNNAADLHVNAGSSNPENTTAACQAIATSTPTSTSTTAPTDSATPTEEVTSTPTETVTPLGDSTRLFVPLIRSAEEVWLAARRRLAVVAWQEVARTAQGRGALGSSPDADSALQPNRRRGGACRCRGPEGISASDSDGCRVQDAHPCGRTPDAAAGCGASDGLTGRSPNRLARHLNL